GRASAPATAGRPHAHLRACRTGSGRAGPVSAISVTGRAHPGRQSAFYLHRPDRRLQSHHGPPPENLPMPPAYHQRLDPLRELVPYSAAVSTLLAALPVLVLFWLLVPRRWLAPKAGAAGALVAIVVAVSVYQMPAEGAVMAFVYGAGFG